jgi:hypothetical protein
VILDALRRAGIDRGLLGGSRPWLVVGALAWGLRLARWAMRRHERVLLLEELAPGERLLITHTPVPSKRRRGRRGR